MGQFRTLESFAYSHRNRHRGEVKKHIKFDENNGSLYVQLKHTRDEDWSSFSYTEAKREQEKINSNKVRKSFIFQTPTKPEDDERTNQGKGAGSSRDGNQGEKNAGSFEPPPRPDIPDKNSWRPPTREEPME